MKRLYIYILTAVSFLGLSTSCNDFGDVNVDPENPNQGNMDYRYLFTQVQAQIAGSDWDIWRNACIYSINMMQQTSSVNWSQGVFYTYNSGYSSAFWDNFYSGGRGTIRNTVDILHNWKGNPNYAYEYQYTRIMKAYIFHRMTDLYGDVPYSQAGLGYIETIGKPVYDTQKGIYDDLLNELDEVNVALSALPVSTVASDIDQLYNGDSEKWRKFANSLMLRLAMRLTKVDPTKAATYVQKAVSNGLFTSSADDAILVRKGAVVTNDSAEPFGKIISQEDSQAFYLSEYFVNNLKSNNDPRLYLLGTKVSKAETRWTDGAGYDYGSSSVLDSIRGLPIGYRGSGDFSIYKAEGFPQRFINNPDLDWRPHYALINRYTFARPDGPSILVTYAQNNLLLSEAAAKGFISGSAQDYFTKGVQASMEQYSNYDAATSLYNKYLTPENVSSYINSRLTAFSTNPLKEINWEYYVLTFGDPYETFANWRRSGYPELSSVYAAPYNRPAYPNRATSEIPRRFVYPTAETTSNKTNYDAAVKNLDNGDTFNSRVWWDAK